MIYYFMIFVKLKHQTKHVATQRAHILYINKETFKSYNT